MKNEAFSMKLGGLKLDDIKPTDKWYTDSDGFPQNKRIELCTKNR